MTQSQYTLTVTDGTFQTVTKAIAELEMRQETENTKDTPYYQDVFEGLSQYYDLVDSSAYHGDNSPSPIAKNLLHLFAGRATKLESSEELRSSTATSFASLRNYSGNGRNTDWMALRGITLTTALWKM